jgi:drug/metabolite transporter (DMT)-like permease
VPPAALALALAAALAHALWNLLLARTHDPQLGTAVALPVALVVFAPLAAVTWHVSAAALPYVALSGTLELAYFALLAVAYRRGELSVVYPLARGSAPVLVLLVGGLLPGAGATSPLQVAGVLLVALGSLLVRGLGAPGRWRDAGLGVVLGACIASYTLVDQRGLRFADPIAYLEAVLVLPAVVYCGLMVRARSPGVVWRAVRPTALLAGALMFGAYVLVLAALQLAPAAAVAATRETSVVIAVVLAERLLGERVGRTRRLGAVVVAAGVAALAVG